MCLQQFALGNAVERANKAYVFSNPNLTALKSKSFSNTVAVY